MHRMLARSCPQDFPLDSQQIWSLWRSRKISDRAALQDMVLCRCSRAESALKAMQALILRERENDEDQQQELLRAELRAIEKDYWDHPDITSFVQSFDEENWGIRARWGPLVILGPSQQAKTWKGMSLFRGRTLKVSCNGLPNGVLPNLSAFNRREHSAILFDEIRADQILGNREVFQSPPWPVKLGQSACAQHEYKVWLYMTALICCTNALQIDEQSPTAEEDQEWLDTNCLVVTLAPGQKWYKE